MDEKDKKEVSKLIKEILISAQKHRDQVKTIAQLTSQDKDFSKLGKDMSDAFGPFHKAARAILDKLG
jgi:hypothetical protein